MNIIIVDMHAICNTTLVKTSRRPKKAPVTADPNLQEEGRFVSPDTDAAAAQKALQSPGREPSTIVSLDPI